MRRALVAPRRAALLAPILLAALLACGAAAADVTPAELPGLYVMNHGRAADSVWLRRDGRYVHRYAPFVGGPVAVDSGAWEVDRGHGGDEQLGVTLHDFVSRSDAETWPDGRTPFGPGIWSTSAQRTSGGRPTLDVNDDLGWAFVRVAEVW